MPQNVRNFWATIRTDDREVSAGPKGKESGIRITIQQRSHGAVTTALSVEGYAHDDGTITLNIFDSEGKRVHQHQTQR